MGVGNYLSIRAHEGVLEAEALPAQEIYPLLGHGPIAHDELTAIQQLREGDVRTLHRFQLGAQRVLLSQSR